MAEIVWSVEAIANLDLIREYIQQFDPAAARRLADSLIAASDSLRQFPERGRPVSNDCRELLTIRPYVIRYRHVAARVEIIRIRHAAQLPDAD